MKLLLWDSTKTGSKKYPASGIKRVTDRLPAELVRLGLMVTPVRWDKSSRSFLCLKRNRVVENPDIFLTAEVFDENDRPGFREWAQGFPGKKVAIFHDAIPIRHPHITWPKSVARHPHYMKMLATAWDQVLAVSIASEKELQGYWRWIGIENPTKTTFIQWGADFNGQPRNCNPPSINTPLQLLQVGILEPRKNQSLSLDACRTLWDEGLDFQLHLAGRVNPHFGKPILRRIKDLSKKGYTLKWHKSPSESKLLELYQSANLCLFPSMAEGCGLPVLESLWINRPVLASNLPSIEENIVYGGVLQFDLENPDSLTAQLRRLLQDKEFLSKLTIEAEAAKLPTWKDAATNLVQKITG
tara:strand:- start:115 stop:1182 length:1068 start_codon:yes stop_codon:yes gene_type:complete